MNLVKTVFKNITSLAVIEVVNQISLLILAIVLPVYLGDTGFGEYSFVMSFTLLISIFLDMGLRSLTIRDVSRNESLTRKYLSNTILLKTLLAFFTFSSIFILANLANYPFYIKISLYIMAVSLIFNSFSDIFRSIFYAHQKMEYGALTLSVSRIIITVFILLFLYMGYGIVQVFAAFLLGNLIALILNYKIYHDNYPPAEFSIDKSFLKYLFIGGIPFGLAIAFNAVFFNFDIVMISSYINSAVTGWYALPVYIINFLVAFFYTISAAIFPTLSKFYESSRDLLKVAYEKSFRFLLLIVLPVPPILYVLSDKLILSVFGAQFLNSIVIFQILIWLLIPIALARFLEVVLASVNRQKTVTYILGIFALTNIILDVVLIPVWGYMGAIVATVISQISVFILDSLFVYKLIDISMNRFGLKMALILMIICVLIYLMGDLNPIIVCIILILAYISLVVVMGCLKKEDLDLFRMVLKRS